MRRHIRSSRSNSKMPLKIKSLLISTRCCLNLTWLKTANPTRLRRVQHQARHWTRLCRKCRLYWAGSADLTPSNNTRWKDVKDFQPNSRDGRYIRFGVREHGMGAIMNGISVSGLTRAFGGTFLVFSDYMRGAVRVAAISHYPTIFVWTHDSIGVGEDGPTHQPVEHFAALRAIPNLLTIRPADAYETAAAWKFILQYRGGPVALLLTRQNLPVIDQTKYCAGGQSRQRRLCFSRRGQAGCFTFGDRLGGFAGNGSIQQAFSRRN